MKHPRDVLLGAQAAARALPVCDHYSGVEARMRKSLQLQAELHQEFGVGVMDVTLDCEDGAPVGGEAEHAILVTELALAADPAARVAVRVHAVDHPAFQADIQTTVGLAAGRWCHIMMPKVETVADIHSAVQAIDAAGGSHIPLHALIESPLAVHHAFDIAAHPRVQSLSFGLMDFVSAPCSIVPSVRPTNGVSPACGAFTPAKSDLYWPPFHPRLAISSRPQRFCKRRSKQIGHLSNGVVNYTTVPVSVFIGPC